MQEYSIKEVAAEQDRHLEDAAAVYARRRFEGGSARHVAAMERFPASRRLELAPLRYLLPEGRSCLFDLFAGTGFASGSVRGEFRGTFLLEPHMAAKDASIASSRRHRACALSAGSFDGLPAADLAVCLAGFHHVLGAGAPQDRDSRRPQRMEALRLWRSYLTSCDQANRHTSTETHITLSVKTVKRSRRTVCVQQIAWASHLWSRRIEKQGKTPVWL